MQYSKCNGQGKAKDVVSIELKKEQDKRKIVIKPNDKMGGQSVMNTKDYVEKVEGMLNATFQDENGEEKRYYEGPIAGMFVDHHFNQIKRFLDESAKKEIISENDAARTNPWKILWVSEKSKDNPRRR